MHRVGGVGAGRDVAGDGHAVELLQEIEVEPGAAELTVGDRPHPGRLELAYGVGDRRILDGPQLVCADLTVRPPAAGRRAPWGAQQAPDVVGAERWIDAGHCSP